MHNGTVLELLDIQIKGKNVTEDTLFTCMLQDSCTENGIDFVVKKDGNYIIWWNKKVSELPENEKSFLDRFIKEYNQNRAKRKEYITCPNTKKCNLD